MLKASNAMHLSGLMVKSDKSTLVNVVKKGGKKCCSLNKNKKALFEEAVNWNWKEEYAKAVPSDNLEIFVRKTVSLFQTI